MATAKYLDREESVGGRPQRPITPPEDAPDSPVLPDPPLTPGEQQALQAEQHEDEGVHRVPGGLPEIPHGDDTISARPPRR
jgi:hypothetical protein